MPTSASSLLTRRTILPLLVALLVAVGSLVHRDTAVVDGKGAIVPLLIADDAYMYARYAKNLLAGKGLVYDPEEPTDGVTSPLWEGVIIAVFAAGGTLERWLPIVGSVSFALLILVGGAFLLRRGAGWWTALVMSAAALNPAVSFHTSFGLETVPRTLLLVAGVVVYLEWSAAFAGVALAGALFGLATTARPDSGLWMLLIAATILLDRSRSSTWRWRAAALFVSAWALVVAPTVLLRLWWFGVLLPNTFKAKVVLDALSLELGARHVSAFALQELALVATFLAATWLLRKDRAGRVIASLVAVQTAYVIAAGGDFMPLYRFLHPVAFLCFLQVGLAIARLAESRSRAAILLPLAAAGLVLSSSIALYAEMVRMNLVRASVAAPDRHERDLLATYLNGGLPAGESVAVLAAGYLPSQLSAPVIDMLGLHSRTIATSGQTGRAFPGHRRFNTDYVLARRPAVICDLKIFTPAFSVPAAEALKHSSEFARLYRSVEVCVPDGTGWAKLSFHLRRDLAIPRGGFDSGGLGCVRAFENMKARGVPVEELVQPSDSTLASSGSSTARSRSSPSERPFK